MNRMLSIAWKEVIQARRDHLTMAMMVGIPVIVVGPPAADDGVTAAMYPPFRQWWTTNH